MARLRQTNLVLEVLDADLLPSLLQPLVSPADDLTLHYGSAVSIQLNMVRMILLRMMMSRYLREE